MSLFLVVFFAILLAQPACSEGKSLAPDIVPGSWLSPEFRRTKKHQFNQAKINYFPKNLTSQEFSRLFRSQQSFMLFAEIIQLVRWERTYNSPDNSKEPFGRSYFLRIKKRSFGAIRQILDESIDKAKWSANPGSLHKKIISAYSPSDPQVKALFKLALELKSLDEQQRLKKFDSETFKGRESAVRGKIRELVLEGN